MSSETQIKAKSDKNTNFYQLLHIFLLTCFGLLIFLNLPFLCETHSHSHMHEDEAPVFKYSAEANLPKPHSHEQTEKREFDKTKLWTDALSATLLISLAPFVILFFVPLDATKEKLPLLKILLSFASGGLLGDAFLHLIPHALAGHSHDSYGASHGHEHAHGHSHGGHSHGHSHGQGNKVGIWVLAGILLFLFVEKGVRLCDVGHSHLGPSDDKSAKSDVTKDKNKKKGDNSDKSTKVVNQSDIKITGYLNLVADITHNFTDGLAIGASFLAGRSVGFVTMFTILIHEVPHEIGDFAILIKSGCSRNKAMYLQLLTAVGAFAGTFVSLMAEGYDEAATVWILPLTAGGFIYIATVSVLPELLSDTTLGQSIKEITALLIGVLMMVFIAELE